MNSTTNLKSTKAPCGCGAHSVKSTGSCNCGGTCGICATCQSESYTRPRFFAGQLLTEDDLQQLNEYVVAKNRLHARHWFGAGVVCGLDVTCYPCGGGKVIVNPGYALDCCGNDIVVACPQELDINQMIRELLRKLRGGYDCGDPCSKTTTMTATGSGGASAMKEAGSASSKEQEGENSDQKSKGKKYCLYISFCEQLTDPVAPYALDDPCLKPNCETTRVREGFQFELGCPCPDKPAPPLCENLRACTGDEKTVAANNAMAGFLRDYGGAIVAAYRKIQKNDFRTLTKEDITQLKESVKVIKETLKTVELEDKTADKDQQLEAAKTLRDATLTLGSELALIFFQPAQESKQLIGSPQWQEVAAEITSDFKVLGEASEALGKASVHKLFSAPLEKAHVESLSDATHQMISYLPRIDIVEFEFAGESERSTTLQKISQDVQVQFLAQKAVVGKALYNQMALSTNVLRGQLIYRLTEQQSKTRCWLLEDVNGAPRLSTITEGSVDAGTYYLAGKASETLGRVQWESWLSCFCSALNPPCPPCDDTRVLLACITVEDCLVKDICNLDREFVLSPVAIRYWFPEITQVGNALEKLCCPDSCYPKGEYTRAGFTSPAMTSGSLDSRLAAFAFQSIRSACGEGAGGQGFITSAMDRLSGVRTLDYQAPSNWPQAFMPAPPATPAVAGEAAVEQDLSATLRKTNQQLERLQTEYQRLQLRVKQLERKKTSDPGAANE